MRKIYIKSFEDIAKEMHDKIVNRNCFDVTFVGLYEDCVDLIDDLLVFAGVHLYQVEIEPVTWCGYNQEFMVTLDDDLNIWCTKAFSEDAGYVRFKSSCLYMADDCNPEFTDFVDADEILEVSYSPSESDCWDDCCGECTCFGVCADKPMDDIQLSEELSEYASEYHSISRTKDGKVTGFTKSWTSEKNGMAEYSSFSYMGNNEAAVKRLAADFGIKID